MGPTWQFTTAAQNLAPHVPFNPWPSDGAVQVPLDQALAWRGGDPDGELVTYTVAFGLSNPPPIVASGVTSPDYDPGPLAFDQVYHWAITATDGISVTAGPPWWFSTVTRPTIFLPLIMRGG